MGSKNVFFFLFILICPAHIPSKGNYLFGTTSWVGSIVKHTTFTLLSLTTSLTLADFAGQKFLFDVPFVTLTGSEPIISEIRAYDSSTAINKFTTILCSDDPFIPHCCVDMEIDLIITNGIGEDVNSVSALSNDASLNGSLCFKKFTTPTASPNTYNLRLGDASGILITVTILSVVDSTNNIIRFTDENGNCYSGALNSKTEDNILIKVS